MDDDVMRGIVESFDASAELYLASFQYQGFNPKIIKAAVQGVNGWMTDLPQIIALYIMRGTRIDKIQNKTSESGIKMIERLKKNYKLVSKVPEGGDRTAMTIGRIVAAFPETTCQCLHMHPELYTGPVRFENFSDIPRFVMIPAFASLILRKDIIIRESLLRLHFLMMLDMDDVIKGNDKTPIDKMKLFQKAAFNSSLFGEEERVSILAGLGVIVRRKSMEGVEFTEELENLVIKYKCLYMPGNDKNHFGDDPSTGSKRQATAASSSGSSKKYRTEN